MPTVTTFGAEYDHCKESNVINYKPKSDNSTIILKKIRRHKDRNKKRKLNIKKIKNLKIFRKLKKKGDLDFWLWVIFALIGIISGLIALGSSAWLIIGIVLGMIIYFGFIAYLFFRYIDNGFKLEWFWWLILTFLLGGGIAGLILLIGFNPVSSAIIGSIIYAFIALIVVILFFILIIAFLKGLISVFKALFHPFRKR